jgi:hypothetical protein
VLRGRQENVVSPTLAKKPFVVNPQNVLASLKKNSQLGFAAVLLKFATNELILFRLDLFHQDNNLPDL